MNDFKITFSCDVFGGFSCDLHFSQEQFNKENITKSAVILLQKTLEIFNLYNLIEILSNKKFHIHENIDYNQKSPIFICSHNCSNIVNNSTNL